MQSDETVTTICGLKFAVHTWNVDLTKSKPRALVIMYHGFLAHGAYPTGDMQLNSWRKRTMP
jgi:hypothetical protein